MVTVKVSATAGAVAGSIRSHSWEGASLVLVRFPLTVALVAQLTKTRMDAEKRRPPRAAGRDVP